MKFTAVEWVVIAIIAGLLVALVAGVPAQMRDKDAFMQDCQKHEPMYSCEVKYKQMHPDPLVVIAPLNK